MDPLSLTLNQEFNLDDLLNSLNNCQESPVPLVERLQNYSFNGEIKIDKSIKRFAKEYFTDFPLDVRFLQPGETKGISGAPVFRVFRSYNANFRELIAVAKAFPKQEEFIQELRAIQILSKLSLKKSHHVKVLLVGKCQMLDKGAMKELPLLLQSAAEGEGLDEHLKNFFLSKESKKEEIAKVISYSARAFVELHENTKSESKADFNKYVVAIKDMVSKCNGLCPDLSEKVERLIKAAESDTKPNGVIIHGDSHPGNIFAKAGDSCKITFIDVSSLSSSISPSLDDPFDVSGMSNFSTKVSPVENSNSIPDFKEKAGKLSDKEIAQYLWLNSEVLISEDMVEKVNAAAIYLKEQGFELMGIKADGDCFCSAFLKSYEALSQKIPILDEEKNKISYLRALIAAQYEVNQKNSESRQINRVQEIKKDREWLTAMGEGDLLASNLGIPIRIVTVNKDSGGCGIVDMLTFAEKDKTQQKWKKIKESKKPKEYIFIVDLGGHFVYSQHLSTEERGRFLESQNKESNNGFVTRHNPFKGNAPPERDFSNFLIRTRDIYVRCLVEQQIDSDEKFERFNIVHNNFISQYCYPLAKAQVILQNVRSLLGTICRCQENMNKFSGDSFLKELKVQRLALNFLTNIMNLDD